LKGKVVGQESFDVVISGGGPAGLTLAIDLGQRGVRTLLLEKNAEPGPWPKMERTNPRSMEIFRDLGLASKIRDVGYPADASMDIFIGTTLGESAISRLKFSTVAEFRQQIGETRDGTQPAEPYQLVSQYELEPVLKREAEQTPNVSVRFGHETIGFDQDAEGVTITARTSNGSLSMIRGSYLVGCDGGSSLVRKSLGIRLEGQGRIRHQTQVQFHSDELYECIPMGKGRHYLLADGSTIVVQGNRTDFTLHSSLPADSDFHAIIRDLIGFDVEFEVLRINGWMHNLLVADRFRDDRVFIAGDAAHLVIPNGGLGMNTAIGDVSNLAWLLAGAAHGWGGPQMLAAYEAERRPVALFNREASRWATEKLMDWKKSVTPEVFADGTAGRQARRQLAEVAGGLTREAYGMRGAELGYNYAGSPLIATEPGPRPDWSITEYRPSTQPGCRLPHIRLKDGVDVSDKLGSWFTVISTREAPDASELVAAVAEYGVAVDLLVLDEPDAVQILGADLLLVRPDRHVAWRGSATAQDLQWIAALATGHVDSRQHLVPDETALTSVTA
jgi:2-polyprenyl-6-methoxyphenol hydroxylase-like FAD-dependent oxidoreductase